MPKTNGNISMEPTRFHMRTEPFPDAIWYQLKWKVLNDVISYQSSNIKFMENSYFSVFISYIYQILLLQLATILKKLGWVTQVYRF